MFTLTKEQSSAGIPRSQVNSIPLNVMFIYKIYMHLITVLSTALNSSFILLDLIKNDSEFSNFVIVHFKHKLITNWILKKINMAISYNLLIDQINLWRIIPSHKNNKVCVSSLFNPPPPFLLARVESKKFWRYHDSAQLISRSPSVRCTG